MSKYGFLQNAAGHNSHFQFRFPTVCIELCKFVFKWLWMGYINHVCLCCFFPIRYKANDINCFKSVSWREWCGDGYCCFCWNPVGIFMEYYESEWNACNFVYKLVIKLIDDYQMIRASEMVRCIVHQKKSIWRPAIMIRTPQKRERITR